MNKKIIIIIIAALLLIGGGIAAVIAVTGGNTTPAKLQAPTVSLIDDTVTWSTDTNAEKFEISLNGNLAFIESSETSRKLENGQTFKIRAIGDGKHYLDSEWSNSVTYVSPTSPNETYTVVWKNGDVILETDRNLTKGTLPSYDGETPTKLADANYTYTFSGWTPDITEVVGDITYTATFTKTLRKYTVTWYNGDTVLETDSNLTLGEIPAYNGVQPTKTPDAQYAYTFIGWSPDISAITGNVAYYAQFASTAKKYTVTWKNGDAVLETDAEVPYGTTPIYNGATPEKTATAQYTYKFAGWTPTISPVTENITYFAEFTETLNTCTVTFYNEDGTSVLDTVTVNYGDSAVYSKNTPTKNATLNYTYIFDKWVTAQNGDIEANLQNTTHDQKVYASFKAFTRKVSVYIVSNNLDYGTVSSSVINNVPYGSSISVNGSTVTINGETVSASATTGNAQYTYSFLNWSTAATVGNDTIITANFSRTINKYTITWKNGDSVLETDANVNYGTTPIYNGAVPHKAPDGDYTYTFIGWSPTVSTVIGNATYTAQFTNNPNVHTVIFYDDDGTTELGRAVVKYGETAVYPNATPIKEQTLAETFTFEKWVSAIDGSEDAVLTNITANKAVYAKYTTSPRTYKVTFLDWDGTLIHEADVVYGASATMTEEPERDGYRFDGWDNTFDSIRSDTTVTAKYQAQVLVEFIDYDGSQYYFEYIDLGSHFTNMPENPTRFDYKFTGWSSNTFTNIFEDLTVYAEYVRTYDVEFTDFDGRVIKTETLTAGSAATAPEDPEREGFNFTGWDKAYYNITSDLTVNATYSRKIHTVKFVMPDGRKIAEMTVLHGYSLVAPTAEEYYFNWTDKKAYKFTGWDKDMSDIVITSETVITAVYGEELSGPVIVVDNRNIIFPEGTKDISIGVFIVSTDTIYGISLDTQFDAALKSGTKSVSVDVSVQFGNIDNDYTSNLSDSGRYEWRWTAIGDHKIPLNDPLEMLTFNFSLSGFQAQGDYLINILDSTYVIDKNFTKVTPVIVSSAVTITD